MQRWLLTLCLALWVTPALAGDVRVSELTRPGPSQPSGAPSSAAPQEPEAASELRVPPLTGPVVDQAGILDPRARAQLTALARQVRAAERGQGVQLQVLTVGSLQGEPIESFSIRVAEAWKLGTKGQDNDLLIVVSVKDRAVRIEVGGGLEGGLTDAQAGRIIQNTIVPAFRAGAYGEGLYAASIEALSALDALPENVSAPSQRVERRGSGFGALFFILFLIIISIFRGGGGRGGRGSLLWTAAMLGAMSGGRGRGGFGGGGGGWGGGGGGFSGGGASGRW